MVHNCCPGDADFTQPRQQRVGGDKTQLQIFDSNVQWQSYYFIAPASGTVSGTAAITGLLMSRAQCEGQSPKLKHLQGSGIDLVTPVFERGSHSESTPNLVRKSENGHRYKIPVL